MLVVILPLAILLGLFPRQTAVYWMWVMSDPRTAVLIGAVYAGAIVYYVLALRENDWVQLQAGLQGLFVVSAVLLLAAVLDWGTIRPWHPMTLLWLPAYYAPLFLVPFLFRWETTPGRGQRGVNGGEIARAWAMWLTVRGLLYLVLAVLGFAFAARVSEAWPWRADALELRMFLGQPATFALPAVAVLGGTLLWRWHRLALVYLGSLGVIQLAALVGLTTPYRWQSSLGVLLPVMFGEWIVTPLLAALHHERGLRRARKDIVSRARPANAGPAVQYGIGLLGAVYLAIGGLGFLGIEALNPLRPEGIGTRYLLRHLAVNPPHNLVHLALGASGLWASRSLPAAQWWGKLAGTALLALFLVGIGQAWAEGFPPDSVLLGLVALNSAGHMFHLVTGSTGLILGLSRVEEPAG